jgi:hypothetical protein
MGKQAAAKFALLIALFASLADVGCGTEGGDTRPASPQTIRLDWHELDGVGGAGFLLEVRSLRITRQGWSVDAAVTNRTPVTFRITRPHVRGGTKFGLFVLASDDPREWEEHVAAQRVTPSLIATRFDPPIPRLLRPRARWSGTFSGPGRPSTGSFVRIAFGRFETTQTPPGGLPSDVLAVTTTAVQIGQ